MKKYYDTCAFCCEKIEGRSYKCGYGRVHEDCLNEIQSAETSLEFAEAYPEFLIIFLKEHKSDDFLNEFWEAFGEDYKTDIEGWATK